MILMNFLQEIYFSEEFQKFKKEHPQLAEMRFKHYCEKWNEFLQNLDIYKRYQKQVAEANKTSGNWGDGKIGASVPAVVVDWLEWKAQLNGTVFTKKDLYEYLKKHPEWWTVDKI